MVQLLGKDVGSIGYGLMGMYCVRCGTYSTLTPHNPLWAKQQLIRTGLTWRASPQPAEKSYEAMRTALSEGAAFWNGGELYGVPQRNSLHLLAEYFTKYPEDASKVVLSIKGGTLPGSLMPDGGRENTRRSIDECLRVLDGKKFLDLFECARVDPNVPIEETISYIAEYVKEGKIGGISLSEVSANSIRRAHKVHPISAVEVELSLWQTEILENGVAETCAELGIPIVAYSPLGRGFLVSPILWCTALTRLIRFRLVSSSPSTTCLQTPI